MPGNAFRRPNQPASGPAVASVYLSLLGPMDMCHWENGPTYRDTLTPTSSRLVRDGSDSDGQYAPGMIPSPLGRGLPSRFGSGKSF